MPLPREAWQEYLLGTRPQDLHLWSDIQAASRGMTEDHALAQGTEARSDTPSLSTVYLSLKIGQIHQVSDSNSVQNPTAISLDAENMASPIGEEHNVPSQSSHLILEYVNLLVSGLRQRRRKFRK